MAPAIGRSIGEGFRVANKSWAGIAVYAGGWMLVGLGAALVFMVAGSVAPIPEELARELSRAQQVAPAPASETTAQPVAAVSPQQQPVTSSQAATTNNQERLMALAMPWLGRAWPFVVMLVIGFMVGASWLYAGQLGYVTARVRNGSSPVSELWRAGARAVWPLLGSSLLSLAAGVLVALVIGLVAWLASLLPQALGVALGLLAVLVALVPIVWALVSVAFWFIAIVADRLGPMGGLKASVRLVRGRWWKTCGLLACLALIALAIALPLGILEGVGKTIGGVGGGVLVFAANLLQLLVVNLYFGFVFVAACIRYYEDAKAV